MKNIVTVNNEGLIKDLSGIYCIENKINHKKYVYKAMKDCGHPIQGLLHDMSKFTPIEFFKIFTEPLLFIDLCESLLNTQCQIGRTELKLRKEGVIE